MSERGRYSCCSIRCTSSWTNPLRFEELLAKNREGLREVSLGIRLDEDLKKLVRAGNGSRDGSRDGSRNRSRDGSRDALQNGECNWGG